MRTRLRLALVFAGALVIATPVAAQQTTATADHRLVLPAPSPTAVDPPAARAALGTSMSADRLPADNRDLRIDCRRDLPCRVRLRGVLGGDNGGIAVEGTAFTW